MNSKSATYVSLDSIANKILKHPLMKSINYEDIIDHALSVLKIINSPGTKEEQHAKVKIVNHKALVPREALNVKSVVFIPGSNVTPTGASKNAYANSIAKYQDYSSEIYNDPGVTKVNKQIAAGVAPNRELNFKYKVEGGYIKCSEQFGSIAVSFDTIVRDEDGVPMIPNSESLIKAITNYIKVEVFTVLVDLGRINQNSLERAEREYAWYIGQAQSQFQGIGSDVEMMQFINNHSRMFDIDSLSSDGFESPLDKEQINIL